MADQIYPKLNDDKMNFMLDKQKPMREKSALQVD